MNETLRIPRAESEQQLTVFIVSGYFTFLHHGHLDLIEGAAALAEAATETEPGVSVRVLAIINNDEQQMIKKGEIYLDQDLRLRQVGALAVVDHALISIDSDLGQTQTLSGLFEANPDVSFKVCNGGDKSSHEAILAQDEDNTEIEACRKYGAENIYGVGGRNKGDSTTDIIDRIRNTN